VYHGEATDGKLAIKSMGISQIIEFFSEYWAVIRPMFGRFLVTILLAVGLGVGIATWHDSGVKDTLNERIIARDEQIERYKVVLDLLPASKGNLMTLSSAELRAKALALATKLHDFCVTKRDELNRLYPSRDYMLGVIAAGDEFDKTLKPDTLLVDNEMRRRILPQALAGIRVDTSLITPEGIPIEPSTLLPDGSYTGFMSSCYYSGTIAQIARVLPVEKR
jgi:hypothetical protein